MGYIARECPNKHLVTLVEESAPIYDTEDEKENDGDETEVVYVDHGELLIAQRVLNVDVSKTIDDN